MEASILHHCREGCEHVRGRWVVDRAMPLKDFIAETIALLTSEPTPHEIAVERVKFLSEAVNRGEYEKVFGILNTQHYD